MSQQEHITRLTEEFREASRQYRDEVMLYGRLSFETDSLKQARELRETAINQLRKNGYTQTLAKLLQEESDAKIKDLQGRFDIRPDFSESDRVATDYYRDVAQNRRDAFETDSLVGRLTYEIDRLRR